MKLAIRYNQNLTAIIPTHLQSKAVYAEKNLQIIRRGLENSIELLNEKSIVIGQLIKTAHDFGFEVNTANEGTVSRLEMCSEVILANFSFLSIEQIRHAFLISAQTDVDMESYGKEFNAVYLMRVLKAYVTYINEVLPSIKNAAKIAANRAATAEKKRLEIEKTEAKNADAKRLFYVNACKNTLTHYLKFVHGVFDVENVEITLITALSKAKLVNLTTAEKMDLKGEAIRLVEQNLTRQAVQVENQKGLTNSEKSLEKRRMLKLKEVLAAGVVTTETQGLINAYWCKVGLQSWVQNVATEMPICDTIDEIEMNIAALKKKIMTAFFRAGLVTVADNFDFDVTEALKPIIKGMTKAVAEVTENAEAVDVTEAVEKEFAI